MTSLSNQLEVLRTATARHLTIEKRHVSLLFDKKDANTLDDKTAWRIGVSGLEQMKRIDPVFNTPKSNKLFDEDRLRFVRSVITKEDNENLDAELQKLLFHLSPYLQHFACQQVLEYLIHTYQIYAYNAEMLIITFLPFHDTRIYARLLAILDFDYSRSKEWGFLDAFKKIEQPVPFNTVVKAALSGTYSIVTRLTDHIKLGAQVVGAEFLESSAPIFFNFYAKLLVSLFNDPTKVDENLLSKLMPLIEHGAKSPMVSFRYAAFMVICQLSLTVKLKSNIVQAIVKMLIMKIRADTVPSTLSTLIVVCQQQNVESFSFKAVQKLLRNSLTMGVWKFVQDLSTRSDLTNFLKLLWEQLFRNTETEIDEETSSLARVALFETSQSTMLTSKQAQIFLNMLIQQAAAGSYFGVGKFVENVYAIAIRFCDVFEELNTEWKSRDLQCWNEFCERYHLKDLILIQLKEDAKKKRTRRRSNSMRKSTSGDVELENVKQTAAEKAEAMSASSEFSKRQVFIGDPLKKALSWLKSEDWTNLNWALLEMTHRQTYFKGKPEDDLEEFFVEVLSASLRKPKGLSISSVRSALANVNPNAKLINDLLSRHVPGETSAKRAKILRADSAKTIATTFVDESTSKFHERAAFVLEWLKMYETIPANSAVVQAVFEIIKEANAPAETEVSPICLQQLAISVLTSILNKPGKYAVSVNDIDLDVVVETMRGAQSHHLLRECLSLLTAAVRYAPSQVIKHIMSVFTFMGNGLLRKDNEMTLRIVERTVESLFHAVVTTKESPQKLIDVTRLFSASVSDIPAHRRAPIAQAIARAVGAHNAAVVTMVLLATYCARWQRSNDSQEAARRGTDQEAYDDFAIEMLGALDPFDQLSCVLDLIEYVLRLGGDTQAENTKPLLTDTAIFDRSNQTLPRLRHFRYVTVSLIARIFASRTLIEKLASCDDEKLLEKALPMSRRLLNCSVELDDFASAETTLASKNQADSATQRYWVAFSSRAEIVSEKLRHLLPGGVAAHLIADVLSDSKSGYKICEKALQLANIKLCHDGHFFNDCGVNEKELVVLAQALNKFVHPEMKNQEKMMLCQNAAYTLKLIAKHLPLQSESKVLAETMQRCVQLVTQYQKLDDSLTGNVLLLAGELIRSHNIRSTMQHANALLKVCLSILTECIVKFANNQKSVQEAARIAEENRVMRNRGQRIRQQSLGGLRLGSETLLICSLTCVQRIFDQYSSIVCDHVGEVIVRYCRLAARFGDAESAASSAATSGNVVTNAGGSQTSGGFNKSSVQHRISLIRRSLLSVELRTLPSHFFNAVEELTNENKALAALCLLVSGYFDTPNRATVVLLRTQLTQRLYLPILEFRSRQRQLDMFENMEKLERAVFDSMISMAEILSEVEFRPVVNAFVAWSEPGLLPSADLSMRLRLVPLMQFANSFYKAFNSLALPYFGRVLEISVKVLHGCNWTLVEESTKLILHGKRGSIESLEANFLIEQAIDLIANCARHKEFFTPDRAELVSTALVEELINTKLEGHEKRCTQNLVHALYRVGDADPENFSELLGKILLKSRDSRAKIRYRTLLVLEQMLERIGDGIAPYLTLLVPYLNELDEDENKQVEEQCKRVVDVLQIKFGEKFWASTA